MSWAKGLGKVVNELRWQFCQKSSSSQGMREFVKNSYLETKKSNPTLPILVREAEGIEPRIVARYGYGVEKAFVVSNLSSDQISKKMDELVTFGKSQPKAE